MKLLVVEDEVLAGRYLEAGLAEDGFAVDVVRTAGAAEDAVRAHEYDAIVLDVQLPGGDGFTLCRRWRAAGIQTPILFLTARDDVADRVRGLELGADDYLVKPFAFAELVARLRALLRRTPATLPPDELRIGPLVLDTARREARRDGQVVALTRREYQILELLVRNPGRVISRAALWEHVWASDAAPDSNVVDVYVRYLRNKLGRRPDLIRTVRGEGYALDVPGAAP